MENRGPILIELDATEAPADVAAAPEVDAPEGAAMQAALAGMAGKRGAGPGSWALAAGGALVSLAVSVAAWDFAARLIERAPVLGWLAAVLAGVLALALVLWAGKEALGYARVSRLDRLRARASAALVSGDLTEARAVAAAVAGLYGAEDRTTEALDAEAVIEGAEAHLLIGLDARVEIEIQTAARAVALATAIIPLAFADVAAALSANLRMIRRIAEIYGGRPGAFGNWRLARSVAVHLMATGLVAVTDDVIHSVAGGGLLSKLSRRFGEGVVNGALTARVGLAAMELCRPLPFRMGRKPGVSAVTATALKGLFDRG
ncbi:YcjF family protein [Pararhodobacter aggregans]|uniref:YcjF family protein n=1 Tax=Pararhodobacter aggregans TaxID=404875 RepID=UPI003A8FE32D